MEQVLGEDEVIDCACLEWGNEALKLPATAHGNQHVGADGLCLCISSIGSTALLCSLHGKRNDCTF